MFKKQEFGSRASIVSLFCDPFAAAAAVRRLSEIGIAENEIDLIGFLGSHVSDWQPLLSEIGLPAGHADFCREEFEDGAIVLVIRISQPVPKKSAVRVLKQYGGVLPEESSLHWQ